MGTTKLNTQSLTILIQILGFDIRIRIRLSNFNSIGTKISHKSTKITSNNNNNNGEAHEGTDKLSIL